VNPASLHPCQAREVPDVTGLEGGKSHATATHIFILLLFAIAPAAAREPAHWVGTWASSQQIPEDRNALPNADLEDATLRQIVRTTIGGGTIRIRLSNVFGTEPLRIGRSMSHARPIRRRRGSIRPPTGPSPSAARGDHDSGRGRLCLRSGGARRSGDEPPRHLVPSSRGAARQTSHPGSRATTWFVHGDQATRSTCRARGRSSTGTSWRASTWSRRPAPPAIVTLGDSITDGSGVQPDTDRRWPDHLARRLQADPRTRHLAVLNHGIGGNRMLLDGLGPNALARFERDVLAQPGVRYLILLEGVNDLGTLTRDAPATPEAHRALVDGIIGAYRQMVERARARGIRRSAPPSCLMAVRILPSRRHQRGGPPGDQRLDPRPGNFDALIDFDALMRDPANPSRMRADLMPTASIPRSPAMKRWPMPCRCRCSSATEGRIGRSAEAGYNQLSARRGSAPTRRWTANSPNLIVRVQFGRQHSRPNAYCGKEGTVSVNAASNAGFAIDRLQGSSHTEWERYHLSWNGRFPGARQIGLVNVRKARIEGEDR
jgi:hypothetical protein